MVEILLGTSGWSYAEWVGPFYQSEDENKLTFYSKIFRTAEVDSTFYSYPSRGLVYGWARYTQPNFILSAKLPSLITHEKKLDISRGVDKDLDRFLQLMTPLHTRAKLGPILIQLPPRFGKDYTRLEAFLKILPTDFRFAVEFRDLSWLREETWILLKRYNVAYTIVDEPLLPPDTVITADFTYVRWHGRGKRPWYNYFYTKGELKAWLTRLKEISTHVDEIFGYFNNHFHGYAVENCLQLLKMLSSLNEMQSATLERIKEYFLPTTTGQKPKEAPKLVSAMSFEDLLSAFIPKQKLIRTEQIRDDEVRMLRVDDKIIKSEIRGYHVVIDLERCEILHDCPDWVRCVADKTFCKHLGKIFLLIPRVKAEEVLRRMFSELDLWVFKPYLER
jgi:uncharacterized protein YecE (DUF72 family)